MTKQLKVTPIYQVGGKTANTTPKTTPKTVVLGHVGTSKTVTPSSQEWVRSSPINILERTIGKHDSDSFKYKLKGDDKEYEIRMSDYDSPEVTQKDHAVISKDIKDKIMSELAGKVKSGEVDMFTTHTGEYDKAVGRPLGNIIVVDKKTSKEKTLGQYMTERGGAFNSTIGSTYEAMKNTKLAQAKGLGIFENKTGHDTLLTPDVAREIFNYRYATTKEEIDKISAALVRLGVPVGLANPSIQGLLTADRGGRKPGFLFPPLLYNQEKAKILKDKQTSAILKQRKEVPTPDYNSVDYANMAAAGLDVFGVVASMTGVGAGASIGLGLASDAASFYADVNKEGGGWGTAFKELGKNLAIDAGSVLIPTLKGKKIISKAIPILKGVVLAGAGTATALNAKDLLNKFNDPNYKFKSEDAKQLANVFQGIVAGGRGFRNNVAAKQAINKTDRPINLEGFVPNTVNSSRNLYGKVKNAATNAAIKGEQRELGKYNKPTPIPNWAKTAYNKTFSTKVKPTATPEAEVTTPVVATPTPVVATPTPVVKPGVKSNVGNPDYMGTNKVNKPDAKKEVGTTKRPLIHVMKGEGDKKYMLNDEQVKYLKENGVAATRKKYKLFKVGGIIPFNKYAVGGNIPKFQFGANTTAAQRYNLAHGKGIDNAQYEANVFNTPPTQGISSAQRYNFANAAGINQTQNRMKAPWASNQNDPTAPFDPTFGLGTGTGTGTPYSGIPMQSAQNPFDFVARPDKLQMGIAAYQLAQSLVPTKKAIPYMPTDFNPVIRKPQGFLHNQKSQFYNNLAANSAAASRPRYADMHSNIRNNIAINANVNKAKMDFAVQDATAYNTDRNRYIGEVNAANQANWTNKNSAASNIAERNFQRENAISAAKGALGQSALQSIISNRATAKTDANALRSQYISLKQNDLNSNLESQRAIKRQELLGMSYGSPEYNAKYAELRALTSSGADNFRNAMMPYYAQRTFKKGGSLNFSEKLSLERYKGDRKADSELRKLSFEYVKLAAKASADAVSAANRRITSSYRMKK